MNEDTSNFEHIIQLSAHHKRLVGGDLEALEGKNCYRNVTAIFSNVNLFVISTFYLDYFPFLTTKFFKTCNNIDSKTKALYTFYEKF